MACSRTSSPLINLEVSFWGVGGWGGQGEGMGMAKGRGREGETRR